MEHSILTYSAILIIIEGQFQVFQRFSGSKLVLNTVESRFAALNYYEIGSTQPFCHINTLFGSLV